MVSAVWRTGGEFEVMLNGFTGNETHQERESSWGFDMGGDNNGPSTRSNRNSHWVYR